MRPILIAAVAALSLCAACVAPSGRAVASDEPVHAASAWSEQSFRAFAGFTAERGGDGVTLGGNYEYQLEDEVGLGGFAEVTLSNRTAVVIGGAGFFHVGDRWVFLGGPGVEIIDGDADVIVRVGGWYEFEMDEFTLAPTLFIDLGDGDPAIVVGVTFGF